MLEIPEKSNFRIWKIRVVGDRVLQLRNQIRSKEDLQAVIDQRTPSSTWYSACLFLSPTRTKGKKNGSYKYADNLFLGSNGEIHMDFDTITGKLTDARDDAVKAIKIMNKKGYTLDTIKFTGRKGYQLVFLGDRQPVIANPIERERAYIERRKYMAKWFKDLTTFDYPVFIDSRRIFRCIGTLNKDKMCARLTYDELLTHVPERVNNPMKEGNAKAFPRRPKQNSEAQNRNNEPYSYLFISNKVGKEQYIPFIEVSKSHHLEWIMFKCKNYNLNNYAVFDFDKNSYAILCDNLVSHRRLEKILKGFKALNENEFLKFHYCWIRTSAKQGYEPKIIYRQIGTPGIDLRKQKIYTALITPRS